MSVHLLDCTLRDGGNLNDWLFSAEDVATIVRSLDEAGVDIVEVGYRGGSGSKQPDRAGEPASCRRSYLSGLPETVRAQLAVMVVPSVCRLEQLEDLPGSGVSWVRVAAYPHGFDAALPYISALKSLGLNVSMNLMSVSYVSATEAALLARRARDKGADLFYVADSFGALRPDNVAEVVSALAEAVDCGIGFHGHNNLGLAFANAIAAMESGATHVDASLCGMARGAGNLPTEQFIAAVEGWSRFSCRSYSLAPVLHAAEHVLHRVLGQPIRISTREIETGLSNLHFYYYDLVLRRCGELGVDPRQAMRILGRTRPPKVDASYVESVCQEILGGPQP
jgi:4-hydroxy 2-oxovalerate aldolase